MSGEGGLVEVPQIVRDHRLQPRIRHEDAGPFVADYECLCGERFLGVAEWSEHVAAAVREWLAGVLDEHPGVSLDCGRLGLPCSHPRSEIERDRWCDCCIFRDRLGITGGGQ